MPNHCKIRCMSKGTHALHPYVVDEHLTKIQWVLTCCYGSVHSAVQGLLWNLATDIHALTVFITLQSKRC